PPPRPPPPSVSRPPRSQVRTSPPTPCRTPPTPSPPRWAGSRTPRARSWGTPPDSPSAPEARGRSGAGPPPHGAPPQHMLRRAVAVALQPPGAHRHLSGEDDEREHEQHRRGHLPGEAEADAGEQEDPHGRLGQVVRQRDAPDGRQGRAQPRAPG